MRSLVSPESTEAARLEPAESSRVRKALADLLESRPFRNTQQCKILLRYIVEHTLSGEEGLLRERVIGVEVFGRPAGYETSDDPVVRLRVAEVRKRLAQYYSAYAGMVDLKIEVPPGSYRAVFQFHPAETASFPLESASRMEPPLVKADPFDQVFREVASEIPAPPTPPLTPAGTVKGRSGSRLGWVSLLFCGLVTLALVGAWLFEVNTPEKRCFREFWAPWTSSSRPVILSVGSNAVYRLRYDYVDRYAQQHGLEAQGQELYIPFGKENPVLATDLVPAYNSFVAWGDVAAVSDIAGLLAKQNRSFQDRFPNDVSFAEIRNTPSVLIGGFNNPMTMEMTKDLEFTMRRGSEIVDSENPGRKWLLHSPDEPPGTADFAILTRLVRGDGDAPILGVAGLGQYGTLATAQLVCDPAGLNRISKQLPKNWSQKNLQAVLRIKVVDFKPTIAEVVAFKSW